MTLNTLGTKECVVLLTNCVFEGKVKEIRGALLVARVLVECAEGLDGDVLPALLESASSENVHFDVSDNGENVMINNCIEIIFRSTELGNKQSRPKHLSRQLRFKPPIQLATTYHISLDQLLHEPLPSSVRSAVAHQPCDHLT